MINNTPFSTASIRQVVAWITKQLRPALTPTQRKRAVLPTSVAVHCSRGTACSFSTVSLRASEAHLPLTIGAALLKRAEIKDPWRAAERLVLWANCPPLIRKSPKKPPAPPAATRAELLLQKWIAQQDRTARVIEGLHESAASVGRRLHRAEGKKRVIDRRVRQLTRRVDKERSAPAHELTNHDFAARMRVKQSTPPATG